MMMSSSRSLRSASLLLVRALLRRTKTNRPVIDAVLPDFSSALASGPPREIPSVLYQTIESREVTSRHLRDWLAFRNFNPDLDFHILDREERDNYMAQSWRGTHLFELYERAALGVIQADIFRYAIVYDRGGYYCDVNKGVLSSLSSYLEEGKKGVLTFESNDALVFPDLSQVVGVLEPGKLCLQYCFGFTRHHPLLKRIIERIESNSVFFSGRSFEIPKNAVLQFSSTGMFTQVFREFARDFGVGDISQVPVDFFGTGVFRLDGTRVIEKSDGHYSELRDGPILHSK